MKKCQEKDRTERSASELQKKDLIGKGENKEGGEQESSKKVKPTKGKTSPGAQEKQVTETFPL